jgi:hypothetical protein
LTPVVLDISKPAVEWPGLPIYSPNASADWRACVPFPPHSRLDGVGGQVFTRDIEHTFEHRVILMMREVLL